MITVGRLLLACTCAAAWTIAPAAESPEPTNELRTNGVFTVLHPRDVAEHDRTLRARLDDPQQRMALRAEQRRDIEAQHPGLAGYLQVEAPTVERLFDVLADQQLSRLDDFSSQHRRDSADFQAAADFETGRLEELRAVLGAEGLERFQDYTNTQRQRIDVAQLDARLAPRDKLTSEQKERLVQLGVEQQAREVEQLMRGARARMPPTLPAGNVSQDALARNSQLLTIEANEDALRRMTARHRELQRDAGLFLNPSQLAALDCDW